MSLTGKVAIVTGGARGIGKEYSLSLLNEGAKVCICDINEDTLKEYVKDLSENVQDKVLLKKCDVTNYDNFKEVFKATIEEFGRLDIVVNNAGIANEREWREIINVNLIGVLHGIQIGFQYMSLENGGNGGIIVNTASKAGLKGCPYNPVYCATKHAVVGLTKSYGCDYHFKRSGIKVHAICPSRVDTHLLDCFIKNSLDEKEIFDFVQTVKPTDFKELGRALLKTIEDGKNGSLIGVDHTGSHYV